MRLCSRAFSWQVVRRRSCTMQARGAQSQPAAGSDSFKRCKCLRAASPFEATLNVAVPKMRVVFISMVNFRRKSAMHISKRIHFGQPRVVLEERRRSAASSRCITTSGQAGHPSEVNSCSWHLTLCSRHTHIPCQTIPYHSIPSYHTITPY